MKKASIGMRFLAMLLDSLIISVVLVPLSVLVPFGFLVTPFLSFLYYGIMEGAWGATLGKMACGLRVVDRNGKAITAGTGFFRAFGRWVSSLILGIGYFLALFDEAGLALHDRMAGTIVVQADSVRADSGSGGYVPPVSRVSPKVIGLNGIFAGSSIEIPTNGLIFGRDGSLCNMQYPNNTPGISGTHCKLTYNPGTRMFVLQDLNSTHGTFTKNGYRVVGQPTALDAGSEFYLATPQNLFRVVIE